MGPCNNIKGSARSGAYWQGRQSGLLTRKIYWGLLTRKTVWAEVLKAKYGSPKHKFKQLPWTMSYIAKDLLHVWPKFYNVINWKLGNGKDTLFLLDSCIGENFFCRTQLGAPFLLWSWNKLSIHLWMVTIGTLASCRVFSQMRLSTKSIRRPPQLMRPHITDPHGALILEENS